MGTDLDQGVGGEILSPMEIDAIGEVLNISMGSAATAVSSMLDKQVIITTPNVEVASLGSIDSERLEPAIIVKIVYTEGVSGSNVMVFRQRDMQLILNGLMGIDEPPSDSFVFDELSMSAACEVMNQMMGASATALSDFLGMPVNISTPTASIMDAEHTFIEAVGLDPDAEIISVLFNLSIKDVMNTEFVSVLSVDFAKEIVNRFMIANGLIPDLSEAAAAPASPAPQSPAPQPMPEVPQAAQMQTPQQQMPQMQQQMPQMQQQMPQMPQMQQQMPQMPQMQQQMPQMPQMQQQMPQMPQQQMPQMPQMAPMGMPGMDMSQMPGMGYPPYGYPPYGYPGYGYPPYGQDGMMGMGAPASVKNVQFPEFAQKNKDGSSVMGGNMDLIMNVPLNVSIEIGATKRKIKDIMGFTQGTVIELEKQAGAPVDIIVNGQLIAHGDVVVIDDNFGVRITEIVGTKELLSVLEDKSGK